MGLHSVEFERQIDKLNDIICDMEEFMKNSACAYCPDADVGTCTTCGGKGTVLAAYRLTKVNKR